MTDQSKQAGDDTRDSLLYASMYASYANHCAIQKTIPLTYISWKKAGKPKAPEAAPGPEPTEAPDYDSLAIELARELYDRFVMGGWSPDDAYAEIVHRVQTWVRSWAEAPPQGTPAPEHLLNNLLAVIHRDGGHYVAENGLVKACEDAEAIVLKQRVESTPTPEPDKCQHERLSEEDYCRKCGADMRSGIDLGHSTVAAQKEKP